jgi:hypothetical protein
MGTKKEKVLVEYPDGFKEEMGTNTLRKQKNDNVVCCPPIFMTNFVQNLLKATSIKFYIHFIYVCQGKKAVSTGMM